MEINSIILCCSIMVIHQTWLLVNPKGIKLLWHFTFSYMPELQSWLGLVCTRRLTIRDSWSSCDANKEQALERNKTQQQHLECFAGVSLRGLLILINIPPGESINCSYLDGRFKDGWSHIANSILERVGRPRTVRVVAGVSRELNTSKDEIIIALPSKRQQGTNWSQRIGVFRTK